MLPIRPMPSGATGQSNGKPSMIRQDSWRFVIIFSPTSSASSPSPLRWWEINDAHTPHAISSPLTFHEIVIITYRTLHLHLTSSSLINFKSHTITTQLTIKNQPNSYLDTNPIQFRPKIYKIQKNQPINRPKLTKNQPNSYLESNQIQFRPKINQISQ